MCMLLFVIFFCIALLLPFVLGFCLSVFFLFFFSSGFSACYHWWVCFFGLVALFFLSFFLPLILSHAADRVLVFWPGVRPLPLRWESQVQDIGPPETSRLHEISNGESSPGDLHLDDKTQVHSTTSRLQCWTPYAKQLARQEHNPTQ